MRQVARLQISWPSVCNINERKGGWQSGEDVMAFSGHYPWVLMDDFQAFFVVLSAATFFP
jgi:hypothetical protein